MLNKKDKLLAAAQKFLERGSLDKALLEFQKAAQEDAKDTRTWLRIAEIHVKRGEAPQATAVYLKTAELYVEQGFFQRAAAVYKNVLKLTPGHTDAHTKLAEVYRQLGLLSDSSQQYEQAASALVRAGKPKEAMAALMQILEMNPDQVMIRVKIAEVAAQAGLNDDAIREFSRAAEQLEAQGRTDDFLRVAERLLQLSPDNTLLGKKAAVRYMERQNPKAALAKLQACFNTDNKDVETLQLLASAFTELGQTAKTVTVLKELAKVQEERRQMVERAATLQRIRALDPSDPMVAGGTGTGIPAVPPRDVQGPIADLPRARGGQPDPSEPETPPALPVPTQGGRSRREPTITFSELAVPPILAREPSQTLMLSPGDTALPDLDEEQVNAEVARLLAETDTFVKYGLTERAAEHVRKVFDLSPEHEAAQERLIAILIQLGRTAEAVEELGILADRRSISDPEAAIRHLRRALELDPKAVGARHMLDRLTGKGGEADEDGDLDVLELDDELELLPMVDEAPRRAEPAARRAEPAARRAEPAPPPPEVDEWGAGGATQIDAGAGVAAMLQATAPAARAPGPSISELEIDFDLPVPAQPSSRRPAAEPARPAPKPAPARAPAPAPVAKPAAPAPLDPAVEAELEQVDFLLEQGLADEAIAVLDELGAGLANHPEVRARWQRAQSQDAGGAAEADQALEALREVDEDSRTNVLGAPAVGQVLAGGKGAVPRGPGGGEARAQGREAAITPRAVVATGGADTATQRDLGIAYKEMGLYDAAIAEFSKLSEDPEHQVFALMMIGECYEAEGAFAEALINYKKALNRPGVRDDESTRLYFLLGRAFEALGDQGEALYFFEKVARRDPGFADVRERVEKLRKSGVAPVDRGAASPDDRRRAGAGPRGSR